MNRNLVTRILTSIIAGSVAIAALVISPLGVWIFCVLISLLGMWELMRTCGVESLGIRLATLLLGASAWLVVLSARSIFLETMSLPEWPFKAITLAIGTLLVPAMALIVLFSPSVQNPVRMLGTPVLSVVYVLVPFLLFFEMAVGPQMSAEDNFIWHIPFGIIFLIWTLDSMAYFAGRFLGKHLLFERISPKKTWEGSIGGAIFCVLMGMGFQFWIPVESWNWVVVASIIAVTAQLGDLVESMFKRSLQLKDSGNILPGHGGILDRFDGFLFAIPFIFLYSMFL